MAESQGDIGYGAMLEVETAPGSGVYFEVAEITKLGAPKAKADQQERTHMKSPNKGKEFKGGMIDYGDPGYSMNYIPGSDSDIFLRAWLVDGTVRNTRITYGNEVAEGYPAGVETYGPDDMTPGGIMTATLTLKASGASALL